MLTMRTKKNSVKPSKTTQSYHFVRFSFRGGNTKIVWPILWMRTQKNSVKPGKKKKKWTSFLFFWWRFPRLTTQFFCCSSKYFSLHFRSLLAATRRWRTRRRRRKKQRKKSKKKKRKKKKEKAKRNQHVKVAPANTPAKVEVFFFIFIFTFFF